MQVSFVIPIKQGLWTRDELASQLRERERESSCAHHTCLRPRPYGDHSCQIHITFPLRMPSQS